MWVRFCRVVGFLMTFVVITSFAGEVSADTKSRMDTYWNNSITAGSVTGPRVYKGQSANYYSGGSLSIHAQQMDTPLLSVQAPSLSAGCGGINLFTGGFSFINASALVAEMKAVASNALGYAFEFALTHLCPQCAATLKSLQQVAQDINGANKNSCQLAEGLVNTGIGLLGEKAQSNCVSGSNASGTASDGVDATQSCSANPVGTESQAGGGIGADPGQDQTSKNLAWQAIQGIPFLASDPNLAQTAMTLTGTLITDCDDSSSCKVWTEPPSGDEAGIFDVLMYGGNINVMQCDDLDQCLNPTDDALAVSISPANSMSGRIAALLQDMVSRTANNQTYTTVEQALLGMSAVSIGNLVRLLVETQGSSSAQTTITAFSDMLATQIIGYLVRDTVHQVAAGVGNDQYEASENKKEFFEGTTRVFHFIDGKVAGQMQLASNMVALNQYLYTLERVVAANSATTFASASIGLRQN